MTRRICFLSVNSVEVRAMRMRMFVALALVLTTIACGSTSSSSSPTTPTVPTIVMAPAPAGVSDGVWRVGFQSNGQLYRPDAVHLDMSDFSQDVQSLFAEMLVVATNSVQQKTTFDMIPGGTGTFKVSLAPGLVCGDFGKTAACTGTQVDPTGRIIGGTMQWASPVAMQDKPAVLHEIYRTLGLTGVSPTSGIMSLVPWPNPRPTDEEQIMLLGRYNYPLLAMYAP